MLYDELMPSGLSTFSSMPAVAPTLPPRLGPFTPFIPYSGNIAESAAVEAWASRLPDLGRPLAFIVTAWCASSLTVLNARSYAQNAVRAAFWSRGRLSPTA